MVFEDKEQKCCVSWSFDLSFLENGENGRYFCLVEDDDF